MKLHESWCTMEEGPSASGLPDLRARSDAQATAAALAASVSSGTAHIAFESMEMFLKVLTPNRWVLLRALRGRGPSSIRALAPTLGRDYRGVHADVAALGADRAGRQRGDFGALVSGHRRDGAGRGRFRVG